MAEDLGSNHGIKVVGYWVSLFTHRVRWALTLKGIQYQYIEEDIFNKSPSFLNLNPVHARVPVLVHDGNPLPESQIILEYIDETWSHGPALLPQDPYRRAQDRFFARFVDEKVLESTWHLMFARGDKKEQAVKAATDNLVKVEERLLQGGKKFFGGDTLGHLDLVMGFVSFSFLAWEEVGGVKVLDPVRFPAVTAWVSNFQNHPAVKTEYMPSQDEIVAFYHRRVEELLPAYIARFGE